MSYSKIVLCHNNTQTDKQYLAINVKTKNTGSHSINVLERYRREQI